MATKGSGNLPAFPVRLRNTVRVQLMDSATEDQRARFGRSFLIGSVFKTLFEIPPEQLYCVQFYPGAGLADVSFNERKGCQVAMAEWEEHAGHWLLGGMRIQALFMQERVPLIVQMYNAYVMDQDILVFLRRHCKEVWGGTRLRDSFGVWTGQRRYLVQLRPRSDAPGEYFHPPGSFTIGPDRGYLSYPGQPVYCRRCGGVGHEKATCDGLRCRFCGEQGHQASSCPAPKTCSLCASREHLFKGCPHRAKTYAEMAAATGGAGDRIPTVELQREVPAVAGGQAGLGDRQDGVAGGAKSSGPCGLAADRGGPQGAKEDSSGTRRGGEVEASGDLGLLVGHLLSDVPLPTCRDSASSERETQVNGAPELNDWAKSPFHPGPLDSLDQSLEMLVPVLEAEPQRFPGASAAAPSDIEMGDSPRGCKRGAQDLQGLTKHRLSLAQPTDDSLGPLAEEGGSTPGHEPGITAAVGAGVRSPALEDQGVGPPRGGKAGRVISTANRFAPLEGLTEGTWTGHQP